MTQDKCEFKEEKLEDWPHELFEGRYVISESGKVYSLFNNKGRLRDTPYPIKITKGRSGYLQVALKAHGPSRIFRCFPIHRTVCIAFNGVAPTIEHIVGHLDGDMYNNHFSNLAWITPKENQEHRRIHGTMATRDNLHNTKINSRMAEAIKYLNKEHSLTQTELGLAFDVSYQNIGRILKSESVDVREIERDTAESLLRELVSWRAKNEHDLGVPADVAERARKLLG